MSSTRRQSTPGPLRQERYASSEAYEHGLIANLVAKRCTVLERAEDLKLVWFIQLISHQEGGLKKLAAELCARFPDRIATPAMRQIGTKPGQIYNANQVKRVRDEIVGAHDVFLLKGESSIFEREPDREIWEDAAPGVSAAAQLHPSSYPASAFVERCQAAAAEHLERRIAGLCLDPATALMDGEPWYFPTLVSTLREFMADWIAARAASVITTIGRKVYDALDYAREMRRLVLVDGLPGIGKSHASKTWCEMHPGCARYVQVPSTNDEVGFFREIAKALGISSGLGWKAVQLRERIEDVLQTGQLMLVMDEFHFAFPTNDCRNTQPGRINWILTALVNKGVAVAGITTPQFFRTQHAIEKATTWTSAQLTRRIGYYEKLPEALPREDLVAVAQSLVPEASADSIKALVIYASNSQKYIEGIKAVRDRARFILKREGRQKLELRDVMRAIDESVMPSDRAFARAVNEGEPVKPSRKRAVSVPAPSLQDTFQPVEPTPPARRFEAGSVRASALEVEAMP